MLETQEQLFTDLTAEQASHVEGGGRFDSRVYFDTLLNSRSFPVRSGGNVSLSTAVRRSYNGTFSAELRTISGRSFGTRSLDVNKRDLSGWSNLPGNTYYLRFRDRADGRYISGPISVDYSSSGPTPS